MTPTRDNIIIEKIPNEKVSPGGIILPDTRKTPLAKGRVIATGNKVTVVKQGDEIFYPEQNGVEFEKNKFFIKQSDVRSVFD